MIVVVPEVDVSSSNEDLAWSPDFRVIDAYHIVCINPVYLLNTIKTLNGRIKSTEYECPAVFIYIQ